MAMARLMPACKNLGQAEAPARYSSHPHKLDQSEQIAEQLEALQVTDLIALRDESRMPFRSALSKTTCQHHQKVCGLNSSH
jgi:hypothetical protein